jgi:Tol biopolymer transport system component
MVTNLAEGKTTSLLPPAFVPADRPPYALATSPALSPDARSIAFAALGNGLWQVDTDGRTYLQLTTDPADDAPRWREDGRQILFLSTRPGDPNATTDIYELSLTASPSEPARRRPILSNVDRFFVVPD